MWRLALVLVTACRIRFDAAAVRDGQLDSAGDATPTRDGTTDGAPTPNIAFVTTALFSGALGGLAGADAICNSAAAGTLPGTYLAFLSTSTTDAITRFASARGWRRSDGVVALDTIANAFAGGEMFAPIDRDEHGVQIDYANATAWTATSRTGTLVNTSVSCNDWTSATNMSSGMLGDVGGAGPELASTGTGLGCNSLQHVFCFGIDRAVAVAPPSVPITGRIAFVATTRPGTTVSALDGQCQSDAGAAGLPGSYLAVVATTGASAASRFTLDARPVQRIDGTLVASDGASFLGTVNLLSFVNQHADGSYVVANPLWTGAASPTAIGTAVSTCNNWADRSGGSSGQAGTSGSATLARAWGAVSASCNSVGPMLCLEQ